MRHRCAVMALTLALVTSLIPLTQAQEAKPAILFASPGEMRYASVGFDYLRELAAAGFEVDYTEGSAQLTWEKVQAYNVVVIVTFPPVDEHDAQWLHAPRPPFADAYMEVLHRFVQAGGGLLMQITNAGMSHIPNDFLKKEWGLEFPLAVIDDPMALPFTNLPNIKAAYTDKIAPTPVSEGVTGYWYPLGQHYLGAHTMPVTVDESWQVVARMGDSAFTAPPSFDRGGIHPRPDLPMPTETLKHAPLFAIRDLPNGGRLAAAHTWHQFSIGSGRKWLYQSEILDKGLGNRRSDYGLLLRNTYRWLADESLGKGTLGGFVTDPQRLLETQLREDAFTPWKEPVHESEAALTFKPPAAPRKVYRGIIGAQTAHSGGSGTVAEYAAAARDAGIDFVIFLEEFTQLTEERLAQLTAETSALSGEDLLLLPGYAMVTNIGNHIFMYGPKPLWPDERLLAGPDGKLFNMQYQDEAGEWARGNYALDWLLQWHHSGNVGFYRFSDSGKGMRMYDLRPYSAAAVRTYENGQLLEDMTDEYLTTCQSFAVPSPVVVNIVKSPAEMRQAAETQALTRAAVYSHDHLLPRALRWSHSYDGLPLFISDGPLVHQWFGQRRVVTFGAERFVSGRSLDVIPIHVTSEKGLKEIRIYNGQELFRRFDCHGEKEFATTLFLSGIVQRSLVLIAEDLEGGKATTFAHRTYKDSSLCPVFCSDHVNDCGHMLLAHGPHWPAMGKTPTMPDFQAGASWDGGAHLAQRPLITPHFTHPWLETSLGRYHEMPYQIPLVESSDEGMTRCRMIGGRRLEPEFLRGWTNAWTGYGPLVPEERFDLWASHTFYGQYTTGVEPMGYGGPGLFGGPITGVFTEEFTWKQPMTINRLHTWMSGWRRGRPDYTMIVACGTPNGDIQNVIDATTLPAKPIRMTIEPGGWFAVFSSDPTNTALLINRGERLFLELNPPTAYWLRLWADIEGRQVQPGETYWKEMFSMIWPLDQSLSQAAQLADVVRWLNEPVGMELLRGTRGERRGGLFELELENGAVEFALPQETRFSVNLPVRVNGMNRGWTAGLYQLDGFRTHYYSKENTGWTELGVDFAGAVHVPVFASMSPQTHMRIGHPLIADAAGSDLLIQVTCLRDAVGEQEALWHASVNNPTALPITTTIRQVMELPGLRIAEQQLTIQPGEYRLLTGQ